MDAEVRCSSCGAVVDGGAAVCAGCGAQLGGEGSAGQVSDGGLVRHVRPGVTPARLVLLAVNLALFVIGAALTASQFLLPPTPAHRLSPGAPSVATAATAPGPQATSAAGPGFSTPTATPTARAKGNGGGTGQAPTAIPTATLPPATLPPATPTVTATATATPTPTYSPGG